MTEVGIMMFKTNIWFREVALFYINNFLKYIELLFSFAFVVICQLSEVKKSTMKRFEKN